MRWGHVSTFVSELKELVMRDKVSNVTGDPAPCAESDPTSS